MTFFARHVPPGSLRFARDDLYELVVSLDEHALDAILLVVDPRRQRLVDVHLESLAGCADEFEVPC